MQAEQGSSISVTESNEIVHKALLKQLEEIRDANLTLERRMGEKTLEVEKAGAVNAKLKQSLEQALNTNKRLMDAKQGDDDRRDAERQAEGERMRHMLHEIEVHVTREGELLKLVDELKVPRPSFYLFFFWD